MGWSPRHDTSPSLPPPIPPTVPASSLTPQTLAARTRGQRLGQLLRRHAEMVLTILGVLGITLPQAAQGAASVIQWGREQGLYPALAVIAIGVAAAGIRKGLSVLMRLYAAVQGLSDRLDALAHRWEVQHGELRSEVQALRSHVDTGPHARIDADDPPSAKTPTDPRWPPLPRE